VYTFRIIEYLSSSEKGFQNHFLSNVSRNPSLHFVSLGNSMSSILSTFSSRNFGSLRSSSVCSTTCRVRDDYVSFACSFHKINLFLYLIKNYTTKTYKEWRCSCIHSQSLKQNKVVLVVNHEPYHKNICGSGDITPHVLKFDIFGSSPPGKDTPVYRRSCGFHSQSGCCN
jgi:hypothetical protein